MVSRDSINQLCAASLASIREATVSQRGWLLASLRLLSVIREITYLFEKEVCQASGTKDVLTKTSIHALHSQRRTLDMYFA